MPGHAREGAAVRLVRSLLIASLLPVAAACHGGVGTLQLARPSVAQRTSSVFDAVVARADEYRLQVLVSPITLDTRGHPQLERRAFRLGAEYFYPASAIKLTAAVGALEVLRALDVPADAALDIAPLFDGDAPQRGDQTNLETGEITVAHELRKLALVSDNRAFNRLMDVIGFDDLQTRMHALGLTTVHLNHRLSDPRSIPAAWVRASAASTFRLAGGGTVSRPARAGTPATGNRGSGVTIGTGFATGAGVIPGPVDFRARNGVSLRDLQDLLVALVRPDLLPASRQPALRDTDRRMLVEAMTIYPRESTNPVYDALGYPDESVKFLLPGVRRVCPATERGTRIEMTSKSGQAYGFTVENAYLHNPANGRAVFVAAVLYTNADGVLNDDRYEYDTIALPFLADLGEVVARRFLTTDD